MKCLFCQADISSINDYDLGKSWTIFRCIDCQAEFIYDIKMNLSHYWFVYKEYTCYFMVGNHYPQYPVFRLYNHNRSTDILNCKEVLNITPQNIEKRLPTILTFY